MDHGGPSCIAFGGLRVDDTIEEILLGVVGPGAVAAAQQAASQRLGSRTRWALPFAAIWKRRAMLPTAPSGSTTQQTLPTGWWRANSKTAGKGARQSRRDREQDRRT